jgi:extracellular factor (EF) 3-hydroxypalmitic acid methyl ester biosynthesis protein
MAGSKSSETEDTRDLRDSFVTGLSNQGWELRGSLIGLTRHQAVFEVYSPSCTLRVSEVLTDFRIVLRDRTQYSGQAVVVNLVNTGVVVVCEASLEEGSWREVEVATETTGRENLSNEFDAFLAEWQKLYLVSHDYKVIVADLQSFLSDLRLWLDQVELNIRATPAANRTELEQEIALELRDSVIPPVNSLFDRFEEVSNRIDEELRPAHSSFGRRLLHPLLLCAPFIYRCYTKPLGYAGDYEMMNMIIRNGFEGGSLFAKLVNSYLLDQAPPHAVRNRVSFLKEKIIEETSRCERSQQEASIYNLACGPAREVEEFLSENEFSNQARFRLVDFNDETLSYTGRRLDDVCRAKNRRTSVVMEKKSVHQLLKANMRPASSEPGFDLIYSSGLYDYLSDRVCKSLNTYLYDRLRPGGVLVVGNFAPTTPRQNLMEHLMEWFLIYRDSRQLAALAPDQVSPNDCVVRAEPSGANIFLEVRKPA